MDLVLLHLNPAAKLSIDELAPDQHTQKYIVIIIIIIIIIISSSSSSSSTVYLK